MDQAQLFGAALGLQAPWQVTGLDFDEAGSRLDIGMDFPKGARFACSDCATPDCPVHDTETKTWRHLDFFQHQAYLTARVPRVRCPHHGVRLVNVPWARPGSGFTLLFEALILQFAKAMPVATVATMVGEHDTLLWRIVEHYVRLLRENEDFSGVERVGADETSARKGHDYVTIFMDLDKSKVLFATDGKDASTVERFATDLDNHGGAALKITEVSIDMSPAFISGVDEYLPAAEVTFDRFHVMKALSTAVDEVRRAEQRDHPELQRTRYVWLKNRQNLTAKQMESLVWLTRPSSQLKTARAHRWREDFQGFYDQADPDTAETYLRRWCYGAKRSRLQPIKDFVRMIKSHWDGITSWHHTRIANGLLEGTNSLIQAAKARARGYRSKDKMITIVYLIAGKLPLPTVSQPLCATHTI